MKSKNLVISSLPALLPLVGVLAFSLAWQGAASLVSKSSLLLPTPIEAASSAALMLWSGDLNNDLAATLGRWLAGFFLATFVGAPLGMVIGASPVLRDSSSAVLDFFRSLPVTAVFPVFLLFFGVGDTAMIAMAFAATFFIIIMHSSYGAQSAPSTRQNMARSFGASRSQIFFRILAVEALHHTLVGMRTALSLSLVVTVVSEMFIGATHGLGQRLFLSYQLQLPSLLFGLVLIIGILGYVANALLAFAERRLSFWVYP